MFRKPRVLITAVVLAISSLAATTVYAQSGYFNTYTTYTPLSKSGYFTAMQGMCVDRNNNDIYAAKLNSATQKLNYSLLK